MKIQISYQDALNRFPIEMKYVFNKIIKGKSKHKNDLPETFKYFIEWCVIIERGCYSFQDILEGKPQTDREFENSLTEEQLLKDYERRCCAGLTISKNKSSWQSENLLFIPDEILIMYKETIQNNKKEKLRYDSLSEEDKQKELNDTLTILRGMDGFMEL